MKRGWMTSNYSVCLNAGFRVNPNWAYVFVFRKYDPTAGNRSTVTREEWIGQGWSSGVWYVDFSYGSQPWFKMGHSATYSDKLVERLTKLYTREGDLVLDPFLGTGTTMMVAKQLGRSCIGYEINPDFLPIIRRKTAVRKLIVERRPQMQEQETGGQGAPVA